MGNLANSVECTALYQLINMFSRFKIWNYKLAGILPKNGTIVYETENFIANLCKKPNLRGQLPLVRQLHAAYSGSHLSRRKYYLSEVLVQKNGVYCTLGNGLLGKAEFIQYSVGNRKQNFTNKSSINPNFRDKIDNGKIKENGKLKCLSLFLFTSKDKSIHCTLRCSDFEFFSHFSRC